MRLPFTIILLLIMASPGLAQEFEITLPEDLDPSLKPKRTLPKKVIKKKVKRNLSFAQKLADIELYLFHQTNESHSMLERVESIEELLYGASGNGEIKKRVDKIYTTINSGQFEY